MDLEVYKRRLGTSNSSEALVNASIKQVNQMFKNSPLYKIINLDGTPVGVRVSYDKEHKRQLLLQPNHKTNKGVIAEFDSQSWLVTEFIPDLVYPKAKISLCNQVVKWTVKESSYEYPCIAKGKGYSLEDATDKNYVRIAEGDVTIQLPYNHETKQIKESQRFIFGDRAYEVTGLDDISNVLDGVGILEVKLEITSTSNDDDVVDDVANNDDNSSGWGGGW
jgi:hypothetical protein